ncbi:MAG: cysteine-rich CWC family protein [Bacteroidetes bacterium]|nr:cysteine-rich CWC family protein [Bacteroidota bacterium]
MQIKVPSKVCPACFKKFNCHEKPGCWCESVCLSRETLSKLRKRYVDCLCDSCLALYNASKN